MNRAHRAKQEQVLAAASQKRVEGSQTTLRDCANLARSCAVEAAGSDEAPATNETRGPSASPTPAKRELVDRSRDRSDNRCSSPVGSENAATGTGPATEARPAAVTAADAMLTDCKAEAEILIGLGRAPVSSSSSSPSRKRPEIDLLAAVAVESVRSGSQPRSDRSASSPSARRGNGEARSHDRSGERSPHRSPPRLRTGQASDPSLGRDDGDKEACREQQQRHRAFRFRGAERAGAVRSLNGHSSSSKNNNNNAPSSEETSASGAEPGPGLRVAVTARSSSSPSITPAPPGNSDMGFPTAAATAAADNNHTMSESARALPHIVKTPASPSASGETDSEHSDTTTAGLGGAGKSGTSKEQPAQCAEFRRTAAGDSRFRRFHESIGGWDRRGDRDEVSGRRAAARSSGYVAPLVRLAAVASTGRHAGYGAGGMLHERFDCM